MCEYCKFRVIFQNNNTAAMLASLFKLEHQTGSHKRLQCDHVSTVSASEFA